MYIILDGSARYNRGVPWLQANRQEEREGYDQAGAPHPDRGRAFSRQSTPSNDQAGAGRALAPQKFQTLVAGKSFGEEVVFGLENIYLYTIAAIGSCSYTYITKSEFKDHLADVPELREQMLEKFLEVRSDRRAPLEKNTLYQL